MNQLIEDVLVIGKAEADTLEFNPSAVDLSLLCKDLVEELRRGLEYHHRIAFNNNFEFSSGVNTFKPVS